MGGGGVYGWSLFFIVHYLISSFAIILLGKKGSWLLYFNCLSMSFDSVMCLFITVNLLSVGLQCVIVAFPSYTHLLFCVILLSSIFKKNTHCKHHPHCSAVS